MKSMKSISPMYHTAAAPSEARPNAMNARNRLYKTKQQVAQNKRNKQIQTAKKIGKAVLTTIEIIGILV